MFMIEKVEKGEQIWKKLALSLARLQGALSIQM